MIRAGMGKDRHLRGQKRDFAMKDYERLIRWKFKWLATFYDLFDLTFLLDKTRNPRYALARKIPNEPLRILDICVGTANSSIVIAEANDQNEIVGIDLSPDMIAKAKNKIRRQGMRNMSIHKMDAASMSFPDGEFDIAMISFGLHELGHELMMTVLREICRVLKEGGKLYIVDYERQGGIKGLLFSIYLRIFEPEHMPRFLTYDWAKVLLGAGVQINATEKYPFSKMISAVKRPVAG